jgi:histidinol-phosphate aminotransferase
MQLSRRKFIHVAGIGGLGAWAAPVASFRTLPKELGFLSAGPRNAPGAPMRLSYNENPNGPGKTVVDAIRAHAAEVSMYPFEPGAEMHQAIARYLGVPEANVMTALGSSEVLEICMRTYVTPDRPFVTGNPSYDHMGELATQWQLPMRAVPLTTNLELDLDRMLDQVDGAGMVYVCNPNNPTATVHTAAPLRDFVDQVNRRAPTAKILIDEAYIDFTDDPSQVSMIATALQNPNVIVSRTFSKIFGLAGLRLGYGIAQEETLKALMPQRVFISGLGNYLAGIAAVATLPDREHYDSERRLNRESREFTQKALASMGYPSGASASNFIFVNIRRDSKEFADACAKHNILVGRPFPPLTQYARISLSTLDNMKAAVDVFKTVLINV